MKIKIILYNINTWCITARVGEGAGSKNCAAVDMLWRRSSGLIMFLVKKKIQAFLWTQAVAKFRTDHVCDLIKQKAIHTQLQLCPKKV